MVRVDRINAVQDMHLVKLLGEGFAVTIHQFDRHELMNTRLQFLRDITEWL